MNGIGLLLIIGCLIWGAGAQNHTCEKGSDPEPITYGKSTIGKYCTHYNQVDSCCTQKTVDQIFEKKRQAYPSKKECSIQPDFADSCSQTFYSLICFDNCGSIEKKALYYNGSSLKVCKGLAEVMYKACGEYRHCDTSKACGTSTDFVEGCSKFSAYYTDAKAFVESHGLIYVDGEDTPVGTCFSAGKRLTVGPLGLLLLLLLGILLMG